MLVVNTVREPKRPGARPFIGPVVTLFLIGLMLAGCATAPPVQEMSDARQAIRAAREAHAGELAPQPLQRAESYLEKATAQLERGAYVDAQASANAAKEEAIRARDMAVRKTEGE